MICKNCGSALPDEAKFCQKCGASTSQPTQAQAQPNRPYYPPGTRDRRIFECYKVFLSVQRFALGTSRGSVFIYGIHVVFDDRVGSHLSCNRHDLFQRRHYDPAQGFRHNAVFAVVVIYDDDRKHGVSYYGICLAQSI